MLGTYAMREASGEYQPSKPRHMGNTSAGPPSTGTVYRRVKSAYFSRSETNKMRLPSGVQETGTSCAGCQVIRRGVPPSAGITYTSRLPSYSPPNAIHFPSGEKIGDLSCPPVVS